jgi:hypothetical protein
MITERTLKLKNLVSAELKELASDLDREGSEEDTDILRATALYLDDI